MAPLVMIPPIPDLSTHPKISPWALPPARLTMGVTCDKEDYKTPVLILLRAYVQEAIKPFVILEHAV